MKHIRIIPVLIILFCVWVIDSGNLRAQEEKSYHMNQKRREQLMEEIGDGMAIMMSAPVKKRNGSVNYPYRQRSSFYYLTGFKQPHSAFIIQPGEEHEFVMFLPSKDQADNVYTVQQYGLQDAMETFNADTAYPVEMFEGFLRQQMQHHDVLIMDPEDETLLEVMDGLRASGNLADIDAIKNVNNIIHEMRLYKDSYEIRQLKKAVNTTEQAHVEAMKAVHPGMFEYEAEALVEYVFRKNGASGPGFPSIIASGSNATILHYNKNNRKIREGDLLLMDIGAEYKMYTADVTRTIPANGTFSREQKDIYRLVLKALQEASKELVPGKGLYLAHHKATDIIINGLHELGLVTDPTSEWQRKLYTLYPINHWLGLDVHDVGYYGENNIHDNRGEMVNKQVEGRILQPGMVLTIEPGIYLQEDRLEKLNLLLDDEVPQSDIQSFIRKVKPVYEKYKGIGIRIEDDILITEEGNEILSGKAPKTIKAIEYLMKDNGRNN